MSTLGRCGLGQGDAATEMGPVVSREAQQRIIGLIDAGEAQGASVRVDGRSVVVPGHENGFYVGPTVLDEVTTAMDVYRQEIFGPVLSILRADDIDSAIAIVNANPYGNGTAIFTSNGESARRFQRGARRHDQDQRARPRPNGLLLVRRMEGLHVRRYAHPRSRGREVLFARQGCHGPMAATEPTKRGQPRLPDVDLI